MQLSQEVAIPVWMRSREPEQLSRRLEHEIERAPLFLSTAVAAERFMVLTAENNYLLLWLNDYRA